MKLVKHIAAAFFVVLASAAHADTLYANLATNLYLRTAMYFDVTAINSLTIDSFNVTTSGLYDIYYKTGSYAGSELDSSSWTLLGSAWTSGDSGTSFIDPSGTQFLALQTLNIGGLHLSAGQTDGIYVSNTTTYQDYVDYSTSFGNANLWFTGGKGSYGEFTDSLDTRSFSGAINYTVTPTPEPSSVLALACGGGLLLRRRKVAKPAATA